MTVRAYPSAVAAAAVSLTVLVACQSGSAAARHVGHPRHHRASAASASHRQPAGTAPVTVSAVGDTILGNTPSLPSDPASYLSPVEAALRGHAKIVFGNLEGTLTTATRSKCGRKPSADCFAFRNPPEYARYFARDGFTVLNDANNHSHDFGSVGLDQTVAAIHGAGMKQTGLPGEVTLTHSGSTKVAIVAFAPYSDTADLLDLSTARALIRRARSEARVVVVYMHAGAEGTDAEHVTGHEEHYVGEDRGNPERFAHMAIRAGASLVIASGPHVVRGMQFYRHRLIAYSLGNFANFHNFGGGGVLSDSAILHVTLSADGQFRTAQLISVSLDSEGRPTLGGGTIALVRGLSKSDFGLTAARFGRDGTIRPPHPSQ